MNVVQIRHWNPTLSNQTLLRHVQIEEIERVVNGFDFSDFDEPTVD
jgi:hypothetical protein